MVASGIEVRRYLQDVSRACSHAKAAALALLLVDLAAWVPAGVTHCYLPSLSRESDATVRSEGTGRLKIARARRQVNFASLLDLYLPFGIFGTATVGRGSGEEMAQHSGSSKREDILHAAMSALASSSYSEISMQDIATASGITKPTIYYYFASKKGLFAALSSFVTGRVRDIVERELASSAGLRRSLVRITDSILDSPLTSPEFARVHLAFSTDPGLRALLPSLREDLEEVQSAMVRLFERGRSRGEVREDADIDLVCRIFGSVLHTYLAMRTEGRPGRRALPRSEQIVGVLMQGVACDPGGRT